MGVRAPGNLYVTPLRFKLGGRPVLSARLNVETAGSDETAQKFELGRVSKPFCDFLADPDSRSFSRF
jgi:hypothetical protein